jgi:hypothetical protein
MPHPLKVGLYPVVLDYEKHIGRTKREIMAPVLHRILLFKSPMYKAFRTAADPADGAVDPLSPLPGQALHGCGVSSARHGEVRGCRRACESTPPGAAAAAPQAGAVTR